jgi:small subunit ribosomal protein S17
MATKKEGNAPAEKEAQEKKAPAVKKQPKASEAKKVTKKTESAAEIDTVQDKKNIIVRKKVAPSPAKRTRKVKSAKPKKAPSKDIGVDIEAPMRSCDDPNCPFHGTLPVRGFALDVQLVSDKMDRSVVVMRERRHYIKKYQRYEKRSSRFLAHMPPCIEAQVGDMVRVMECRPISKGTTMVVIGRI